MLKRVGESRHPCRTPTVVQNQSPMLPLKRTTLVALLWRFLMTWIRFVLMLYFFMVAHKAAEDMIEVLLVLGIFLTENV